MSSSAVINREKQALHTYKELEWLVLRSIDGKPLPLRSISDYTSEPHDRCARALRSLIRQEKVIPVRERREIVYELIPGSLINWILEHEE